MMHTLVNMCKFVARFALSMNGLGYILVVVSTLVSLLTSKPLVGMCALVIVVQSITSSVFMEKRNLRIQEFITGLIHRQ